MFINLKDSGWTTVNSAEIVSFCRVDYDVDYTDGRPIRPCISIILKGGSSLGAEYTTQERRDEALNDFSAALNHEIL
jgi:hypothetical protein